MRKILLACFAILLLLVGCNKKEEPLSDGQKFKSEYEALNGQKDEEGNKYSTITIEEKSTVRYASEDEVEDLFLRGTHVVYLGWPSCGWCRRAVPVLIDVVNEYSGMNLYVYNIKDTREAYVNDPNSKDAEIYKKLLDTLELSEYDFSEFDHYEDGSLRLPSSAVYFVKDGEIMAVHLRTVASHLDSYEPLTKGQIEELSSIYKDCLDLIVKNNNPGCSSCD